MALDDPDMQRDARLLADYARGAPGAAATLAAEHAPRVLALARHMLGDMAEAEDVTQEALLRLWRIAPDWRAGEARIGTWLYRVASNLCTDRLRRRRTVTLDPALGPAHDPADDRPGAVGDLIAADRANALEAALARLPQAQRLAVVLRHLEERGNAEIAEIMNLSVPAVESLIARGKRALAATLAPRRDGLGYEDETP